MKKVSKITELKKNKSPFLKKGDVIDIIAPSSACTLAELKHAISWVKKQGYVPRVSKDLLQPVDFLANTDLKRFKDLKKALESKTSKAVWCLRGGYGALRLVPDLLRLKKQKNKIFIGLSDITILHQFLIQKWNWKTIHGPVLSRTMSEKKRQTDYDDLFQLLTGEKTALEFKNLIPLNTSALKNKKMITAAVMGGNLCTFCSLLGTGLQPKTKGYFLFFEDISERGYKVDRMLNQLSQAGIFQKCKGIFFGDFINSNETNGKNLVWSTIENFFRYHSIPVYAGIESDHSEKQRPLYLNTKAELFKNTLKVHSS